MFDIFVIAPIRCDGTSTMKPAVSAQTLKDYIIDTCTNKKVVDNSRITRGAQRSSFPYQK
jgi:hypothetical protein